MQCLIVRRASWPIASLLALGLCDCLSSSQPGSCPPSMAVAPRACPNAVPCSAPIPAPAAPSPQESPRESDNKAESSGFTVRIASFDCEPLEGPAPTPGTEVRPIDAKRRLSLWPFGGPAGAAWNAGDLRCVVGLESHCARGQVEVRLHIANSLVTTKTVSLPSDAEKLIELIVSHGTWSRHLDKGQERAPFKTAVFRAGSLVTCEEPAVQPGLGPYFEFADNRAIVLGFATGE